jgi:RNA polymerase sigma factor (sigma-70 family)
MPPFDGASDAGADSFGHDDGCASALRSWPEQEVAVDELYTQIAPMLRMLARRRFGVPDEDVGSLVNEVFISYLRDPNRIENPRQYLVGAVCNASRAYWRRQTAHQRVFSPVDEPGGCDDPTFESLAVTLAVGTMLAQLGTGCREVLRRRFLDGQPAAVIAEEMETSPGAIRVRIHKCRQRARQIFAAITAPPRPHAP